MTSSKTTNYQLEQGSSHTPSTGRPVLQGSNGIISSGHYLTSMAGMRVLLDGGNAFDAMVAATFAAAVVEPIASYSIGAESVFMLYYAKTKELVSYSGQGVAPFLATSDYYRSNGLNVIPTGPGNLAHLSFTVPGVVGGLTSILARFAKITCLTSGQSATASSTIFLRLTIFPLYGYPSAVITRLTPAS